MQHLFLMTKLEQPINGQLVVSLDVFFLVLTILPLQMFYSDCIYSIQVMIVLLFASKKNHYFRGIMSHPRAILFC